MSPVYEIGPFRLDPERGVRTHAGQPTALGAQVQRPNEYVQKASMLDAAWPGVIVEESNLAVQISPIRRAFAQRLRGTVLDRDIRCIVRDSITRVGIHGLGGGMHRHLAVQRQRQWGDQCIGDSCTDSLYRPPDVLYARHTNTKGHHKGQH